MKKTCACIIIVILAACGSGNPPVQRSMPAQPAPVSTPLAAPSDFHLWLNGVKQEALSRGLSQPVLDEAFTGIDAPSEDIIERDHTQPEHVKTFPEYMKGAVTARRVKEAWQQWQDHSALLTRIEREYGVSAPVLLSLWCLESHFGESQGSYSVIESLTTLAYDGRRAPFFRNELMNALVILEQQHIPASGLTGSWAGAMGQTQFMPTSYLSFAVDYDGDGKKDIWNSDADALASIANYLHQKGWVTNQGWGFAIRLPHRSDIDWSAEKERHPLLYWRKLGIRHADGKKLSQSQITARLIVPDGNPDYALLVFPNYDVLMDWNRSIYFATSVGELADAIRNRQP